MGHNYDHFVYVYEYVCSMPIYILMHVYSCICIGIIWICYTNNICILALLYLYYI